MHHANVFYGHARILARYCGLPDDEQVPVIWGYLQHGWNTHDGFAVGHEFVPGYPKLVWSEQVARRGRSLGLRDYVVIGSAWAYLLAMRQDSDPGVADRSGTLVFPFHGWEGQQIVGDHAAYADQVRVVEGDVPITMCLYWNDFDKPEVRKTYEDRGFRVICNGRRGHMYVGGDEDFLTRMLAELRAHRRVVSNRMGSALLYAASVNCEIGVYGDPMVLANDHEVLGGMARQKRLFPQLHHAHVEPQVAARIARSELGQDVLLAPVALESQLGWRQIE